MPFSTEAWTSLEKPIYSRVSKDTKLSNKFFDGQIATL